jgi:hypothetical protein
LFWVALIEQLIFGTIFRTVDIALPPAGLASFIASLDACERMRKAWNHTTLAAAYSSWRTRQTKALPKSQYYHEANGWFFCLGRIILRGADDHDSLLEEPGVRMMPG